MLDTNICIEVLRGRDPLLRARLKAERAPTYLSTVALAELLAGPLKGDSQRRTERLDAFVARMQVVDFNDEAARHAADIRANLERRGLPIGSYDYLIAGHARSLGLVLVSRNLREFSRIEGLRLDDWTSPYRGVHEP